MKCIKSVLVCCVALIALQPACADEGNVWIYDVTAKTLVPKDSTAPQWKFFVESYNRDQATITLKMERSSKATVLNWNDLIVEDEGGQVPIATVEISASSIPFSKGNTPNLESFSCNLIGNTKLDWFKNATSKATPFTSLKSVKLGGSNLTTINEYSFMNCPALTNVVFNFPKLTKLSACTFANCTSLVSVTGLSGIQTIGEAAFSNCTSLVGDFTLTNLNVLGRSAFHLCSSLPRARLRGSFQSIPEYAFYGCEALSCSVGDIVPRDVTNISKRAFYKTALTGDLILTNIQTIGLYAFQYSDLNALSLSGSLESFGSSTFSDCTYLKKLTFNLLKCTELPLSLCKNAPLEDIVFRKEPFAQALLGNLLNYVADVTNLNVRGSLVRVDTNVWTTFASDSRFSPFQDAEEAQRGMARSPRCFGVCTVIKNKAVRRAAWFAQVNNGLVIRVR